MRVLIVLPHSGLNGLLVQARTLQQWLESRSLADVSIYALASTGSSRHNVRVVQDEASQALGRILDFCPDIILVESLFSLSAANGAWLKVFRRCTTPWLLRIHEEIGPASTSLWRTSVPSVADVFDALPDGLSCIYPSRHTANLYETHARRRLKSHTVPIAVDMRRLPQRSTLEGATIAQVGTIYRRKGPLLTLSAYEQAQRRFPQARLSYVGPWASEDELRLLRRAIVALKQPGLVSIKREQADIKPTIAGSVAVTLHSYSESTPGIALEALMSGRPFIGSKLPGTQAMLSGTHALGDLFAVGDWRAQSQLLEKVLSDGQSANQRALEDAVVLTQRHDIEVVGPQMWSILVDAANGFRKGARV